MFLLNSDIQWGQQVAAMFQIVSTMALELPSFLGELGILKGMSPNVQLTFEPWGHDNHEDVDCECQASDRTAAYVHDLTVNRRDRLIRLIRKWLRMYGLSLIGEKASRD